MDELPARVRALKHELKDWEHGFEREWGRKPTKEDIVAASDGDSHDKDSLGWFSSKNCGSRSSRELT